MPRWLSIAKTEVRIWTSRFRKNRNILFIVIATIIGTYAFFLVPLILNSFYNEIYSLLIALGPSLPYLMYYIFSFVILYIFLWCVTYPLSMTMQTTDDLSGQMEILLSTPIKPHDILFGKFIGRLPTYLIILFAIAPWVVNFFNIAFSLSVFKQILIYLILFAVVVLGMWLGTLLAAYFESKIRTSERSRDYGRAMTFLITIFTVAIMYVMIWVVTSGLTDPTSPLYTILQGFPSTWGAVIVINIFGYGFIFPMHVSIYILLLIGLTFGMLLLGYYWAGHFYSLEPIELETERIVAEKRFYRIFRKLFPGHFSVLFISQLKQFSRKLENFSRIGYAVGISIMIIVFNSVMNVGESTLNPFYITIISYFYPMMVAVLLGCYVIVGSKDHLWIYKKAPNGIKNYVWSVYLVNILYSLIIGIVFAGIASIVMGFTLLEGILTVLLTIISLLFLMAIAIGIAFIFPTFEERGGKMGLIMLSFMGITITIWMGSLFLGIFLFNDAVFAAPGISLSLSGVFGFILLKLGMKKLSSLE